MPLGQATEKPLQGVLPGGDEALHAALDTDWRPYRDWMLAAKAGMCATIVDGTHVTVAIPASSGGINLE